MMFVDSEGRPIKNFTVGQGYELPKEQVKAALRAAKWLRKNPGRKPPAHIAEKLKLLHLAMENQPKTQASVLTETSKNTNFNSDK